MMESFRGHSIDEIKRDFRWAIPGRYNLGVDCSDRQLSGATAMVHERADGTVDEYTFGRLAELSNRFANALHGADVGRGDRVAIILPQLPETAIAHIAVYKLGAIAIPMSTLFGPEALEMRLRDSGAKVAVTDSKTLPKLEELYDRLPDLRRLFLKHGKSSRYQSKTIDELYRASSLDFVPVDTASDDPALLIYTSGTTGNPKGALHGHRVLFGHLPGFELSHDFFPQSGDVFWTPADWAWIGGLLDALFPVLHHGRCIVSFEGGGPFDPERALDVMARHSVRNSFLPPTALKMMRKANVVVPENLRLRTIMSGGEALGEEMLGWVHDHLGVTVNEIYGQTECNYVVGNSSTIYPVNPGSMGVPYPGHEVAIVDEAGGFVPAGTAGEIAIKRPDPVMFLGYWNNPAATTDKFTGDWLLTGDRASADERGYLRFEGRKDDVINSAGYRIGPTEIESTLMKHPAVAMAAAIGIPDPIRGQVVKAYITPKVGTDGTLQLANEIQAFVRTRLAAYEYPREIEFIDQMPLTTTGKIRRTELRSMHAARAARLDT
jgi:acetyl-CoA synthetase